MGSISPKVIWPVIVGLLVTSLQSNISAISPDMLGFLGPWRGFVLGTVTTVLAGVAGYVVRDPNRLDAPPAPPAVPASTVTYVAPQATPGVTAPAPLPYPQPTQGA